MDLVRRMEPSNRCREVNSDPNLPPEIITEILLRLPIRSLLKFKCVCKSWLISISSSQFIKTHFNISTKSNNYSNYAVILASHDFPETLYTCPLSSIFTNTVMDDSRSFDFPMNVPGYELEFVGSRNGLVCISIDPEILVLYNPSIRKLKTLPVSGTHTSYISYGFCYDEIGDDFKVAKLNIVHKQAYMYSTEVKVYSLRNDSWRKIENSHNGLIFNCSSAQPIGGILHWCTSFNDKDHEAYLIFAVNTLTNKYDTLELPKDDGKDGVAIFSLGELNGCLDAYCSYYKARLDVWTMKEYGVNESWSKVVSIAYSANPRGHLWPLFVLKNTEFCLEYEPDMMFYNSRDKSFTTYQIHSTGGWCSVVAPPYIESLVDPSFLGE